MSNSANNTPASARSTLAPSTAPKHSLSTGPQSSPTLAAQSSPNLNASSQKYRASVGDKRSSSGSMHANPALPKGRPASEMISGSVLGGSATPETEAIDRWFEDLQHYEATLEDMAAASLDQNFKEELNAIEQWFRVLSEAERTAALYSLLQSSTQVQIRFFIQVLQQMARADPMTALLSPSGQSAQMEAQMEAKLAAMGFKSPASPVARQFARQSLGPGAGDPAQFLSPNDAHAAATLAQQRAKLKAQANRISAPGTLSHAADALKSPLWTQASSDFVAENRRSPSPSGRPKSTGSDVSAAAPQTANNMLRSPNVGFENELSPMVGGNWASMVNTPLVPMFQDKEGENGPPSPTLDLSGANNRLQGWGHNSPQQSQNGIVLDDAKKFRRSGRISGAENIGLGNMPGAMANFSPGNFPNSGRRVPSNSSPQMRSSLLNASTGSHASQQAALSAQANWRNVNGILTPNSVNGTMSPQDMANALLQQQQMMQAQLQMQQNLILGGMMNGLVSPNLGMGMSMNGMPMGSPVLSGSIRRSPRPGGGFSTGNRTPNSAQNTPGSGANPDEQIDMKLLEDVPAWLRSLRLHKYTTNFEKSNWQAMVVLDDAGLEAHGVSALGARRKLLKVFETVRIKMGMQDAPAGDQSANESAINDSHSSED